MNDCREDIFLPVQRIVLALRKARNLLMAEIEMELALLGTSVTSSQIGALLLLSQGIADSSVRLSGLLGINPGFVTRVVDRMESQGLVLRARNGLDRRVVNLALTETGRHLAARTAEIMPAVLNRRLAGFTPLEFAALSRLLGKLLDE